MFSDSGRHSSVTIPVRESQRPEIYQARPPQASLSQVGITKVINCGYAYVELGLDS